MNTKLKNKLSRLANGPTNLNDKIELEEKILSARFLSEIQKYLDSNKMSKKDFAKKLDVSASFISQLFTGDKIASLNFMAKVQLKLDIKFYISTIDQHELESTFDNAHDAIFNNIFEAEKFTSFSEDEDGFWVYHAKNKPDYKNINNEVFQSNQFPIAS